MAEWGVFATDLNQLHADEKSRLFPLFRFIGLPRPAQEELT